jgi:hypothetical protein
MTERPASLSASLRVPISMSDGYQATFTVSTVQNWCASRGLPYQALIPEREDFTYGPCYDRQPGFGPRTAIRLPEAYMAEVDGHVLGGWGIVLTERTALWDILRCPRADRFNLASPMVPVANRDFVTVRVDSVCDVPIPAGILLESWFAANYHHWLVEHLPRLQLVEMAGVPADVPLLVDSKAMAVPQLVSALRALTDRDVIPLEWGVQYEVEHLYVPSYLFGTGPDLRGSLEVEIGDVTLAPEAIRYLRSRLIPPQSQSKRRIYIDRRAAMAPVRLRNGDAVRAVFEEFGFQTVSPGRLSFEEQRDLFAGAAVIAGESGAAMTNVVLAPQSATMICMQAQRWPLNIYSDLAAYGGQRSMFIVGNVVPGGPMQTYQASFEIDLSQLRGVLGEVL